MISTKGRYAVRVMIDLAEHKDDGNIPLKDIAERQQISKKYLEIIMSDLVKAGMVTGSSGKHGGYHLNRAPEEYDIYSVLNVMEGTMATVACLRDNAESCSRQPFCKTLPLWKELDEIIRDYLSGKTLADLI